MTTAARREDSGTATPAVRWDMRRFTPTRFLTKAAPACGPLGSGLTKRTRAEAPRCGTAGQA